MAQRISSPVLVGRAAELGALAAALERAATWAVASRLGAGWVEREIASLARRARIESEAAAVAHRLGIAG